jgi:two-component system CheB/CheR fusion protein
MDAVNVLPDELSAGNRHNYVAMVAHELRDPLMPIINAASVLKRMPLDVDLVHRTAGVIERQARIMNRLIDDLMNVSRVQSGKLRLDRAPVSMPEVIEQCMETMAPLFRQRGQRLLVSVSPHAMAMHADALRLTQAVRNLVANAAKYGDPNKEVCVRAYRDHEEAVVTVADSGIGIEPAEIESIFGLFAQASQALAPHANVGLGIGLYLARKFAEAHGGSITAASPGRGRGSTFMLRVPCLDFDANAVRQDQYIASKRSVSFLTTA